MKIIRCKHFPPKGYKAMTLVWWLFVRDGAKVTPFLMNHEMIHYYQQREMLVLPFFLWYVVEFLFRLIQYCNWKKAYRNISFEREAYANEVNYDYLKNVRARFAWIKYLKQE